MTVLCLLASTVALCSVSVGCSPQRTLSTADDSSCESAVSDVQLSTLVGTGLIFSAGRSMGCRFRNVCVTSRGECDPTNLPLF